MILHTLEQRHQQNFDQFTHAIQQQATFEDEEDWMEWKGAVEMQNAWHKAKHQLLSYEIARRN